MDLIALAVLHVVCGWTGHAFVKVVTLGKVDMPWGEDDSGSVVTEAIGGAVLLVTVLTVAWIVRH